MNRCFYRALVDRGSTSIAPKRLTLGQRVHGQGGRSPHKGRSENQKKATNYVKKTGIHFPPGSCSSHLQQPCTALSR